MINVAAARLREGGGMGMVQVLRCAQDDGKAVADGSEVLYSCTAAIRGRCTRLFMGCPCGASRAEFRIPDSRFRIWRSRS